MTFKKNNNSLRNYTINAISSAVSYTSLFTVGRNIQTKNRKETQKNT